MKCKDCANYTPMEHPYDYGVCSEAEVTHNGEYGPPDRLWVEGYHADVYMGQDYGCIHWEENK